MVMDFSENLIVTIKLLVFLLLVLHQSSKSSSSSIASDREALISFKSQLFLEHSNPLSTWDQNYSPCNWSGISCNKNGGRVSGIDLSGLMISGTINPSIGNLSFLRSLELQNNQLTGQVPHQLTNLVRLRTLNLSFNLIDGFIPANMNQWKELTALDLMQNVISGEIPREIGYLTKLQVLNLSGNRISGNLPPSLTNISSLVNLNLGTNNLDGPIPSDLHRLINLELLDLAINNLSGNLPSSLYNMSSLVYLDLSSNNLEGDLPGDLGITLPNLLGFKICINRFTGRIPWSLHNLTNIRTISIAHNRLHGRVPPGLRNLRDLEMYNFGFNSIVGFEKGRGLNFLEFLVNSTLLDFLAFNSNLMEGSIPKSIGNRSKNLKTLYMGGNDIYGTIPSSIGQLRGLQLLNLSYASISGEIPMEIGLLIELKVLGLADNMISGRIPDSLGDLRFLTEIDLSKNNLVGRIPDSFGNLQKLISMDLSDNKLNGSIPREIFNIPGFSVLFNLSRNLLMGPVPIEIGLLRNVADIDISDNMLSGNIPATIGECGSLEKLSLARNSFSGSIPRTIGSVRGLEILDLSSNQISGSIPLSLQNLHSLQLLNLSFNKLEGEIPTTGVFAEPFKVHVQNNQNLCLQPSCKNENPRENGEKIINLYTTISIIAAISSVCLMIGLASHIRKGKGRVNDPSEFVSMQPETISYDELRLATNNFDPKNIIGKGSFGFVYKGVRQGKAIAVKVLDANKDESRKAFLAECTALRLLRHRNLIKLNTVCSSMDFKNKEFLALVFEFMSNGSLDDWISGKRRHASGTGLNFMDRLRFVIGIASSIDYLHNETEVPIVHCDLKPSNVLVDLDMTPKVGDFGLARLLQDTNSQVFLGSTHALRGSIGYIPPEYGFQVNPSTSGDVYSFGILVLELFTGRGLTHETFTGGLTLKSWVQMYFPTNIDRVLDLDLLQVGSQNRHDGLFTQVLGVGLCCAAESPDARMMIRGVLRELKHVKHELLALTG